MDNKNPRTPQNGPSYSPRQMSQGGSATRQAQHPAETDRQRPARPAETPELTDPREWTAQLGED